MLKNYLLLIWRNMKRNKVFAAINLSGLIVGMTCFTLIMLWVTDELSYDRFNENYRNICRVGLNFKIGIQEGFGATTPVPLKDAIVADFPEVISASRIEKGINKLVSYKEGEKYYTENRVFYADPEIFDIFTIPVIKGNRSDFLTRSNTLVITEKMARKYFGDADPIGKMMDFDNNWVYEVVGVVKEFPENSHWKFDMLAAIMTVEDLSNDNWLSDNLNTYILLKDGTDYRELEKKLVLFRDKHVDPQAKQQIGMTIAEWEKTGNRYRYFLEPLSKIYLSTIVRNETDSGSMTYVIIFSVIALFIFLIACFNFMNLTTAKSALRSKEIGLRKVVGSQKSQIIWQLLFESIVYCFVSMIISAVIIQLILPYFSVFSGKNLSSPFTNPLFILIMIVFSLLAGVLSGIYSALRISSFEITAVLKGNVSGNKNRSWFRSILVIFQFSVSIFIFICTFIIKDQLDFMSEKKLGFSKEQVLVIDRGYSLGEKKAAFKDEILKLNDISYVTVANSVPGKSTNGSVYQKLDSPPEEMFHFRITGGDEDFLNTLNIKLVAGRYFSEDYFADSLSVLINQKAAKALGFTNPVGERIIEYGGTQRTIIGVFEDYHLNSLTEEIPNLLLNPPHTGFEQYIAIKMTATNTEETINKIKKVWESFAPIQPFEYFFLDNFFDSLHRKEQRTGKIFAIFSFLSIIIACLGLYGLAAFTAQQKTKEIGIRKVLGATIGNILYLLLKEFTLCVLLANIFAVPLAWYTMNKWLQSFAYRIEINAFYFIVAGIAALTIAIITVVYQSAKAALMPPVKSLHYE